jgi:hypothetical protein
MLAWPLDSIPSIGKKKKKLPLSKMRETVVRVIIFDEKKDQEFLF